MGLQKYSRIIAGPPSTAAWLCARHEIRHGLEQQAWRFIEAVYAHSGSTYRARNTGRWRVILPTYLLIARDKCRTSKLLHFQFLFLPNIRLMDEYCSKQQKKQWKAMTEARIKFGLQGSSRLCGSHKVFLISFLRLPYTNCLWACRFHFTSLQWVVGQRIAPKPVVQRHQGRFPKILLSIRVAA